MRLHWLTLSFAMAGALAGATTTFAGDVEEGRVLYETECAPCHFAAELPLQTRSNPEARLIPVMMATYGPKLIGIVGRAAGSDPNFLYSANFAAATEGVVWTEDVLDAFLTDAQAMAPRSRMYYSQPDSEIRRKILAYLKTTG